MFGRFYKAIIFLTLFITAASCKPGEQRTRAGGRILRNAPQGANANAAQQQQLPQNQPTTLQNTPQTQIIPEKKDDHEEPKEAVVEEDADETVTETPPPPPPPLVVKKIWEFCMRHEEKGTNGQNSNPICSKEGKESLPIDLGDDRGWQGYRLYYYFTGPKKLCITHASEDKRGNSNTTEYCSHDKVETDYIDISHEEYKRNHRLKIKYEGDEPACLKLTYKRDRNLEESNFYCSKDNVESQWLELKDKHKDNKDHKLFIKFGVEVID